MMMTIWWSEATQAVRIQPLLTAGKVDLEALVILFNLVPLVIILIWVNLVNMISITRITRFAKITRLT